MNFDPSLPNDSRRNFVKKSLAASIIAAQPTILAGLIRAQGGGGGTGTTDPWGTTAPETSEVPDTTPEVNFFDVEGNRPGDENGFSCVPAEQPFQSVTTPVGAQKFGFKVEYVSDPAGCHDSDVTHQCKRIFV